MNIAQQIVGVNERLGNTAVPKMQGTTRAIFDSQDLNGTFFKFFENAQSRPYPRTNINQNRFEVGESLAIESIALLVTEEGFINTDLSLISFFQIFPLNTELLLNLYIGNQRVIKDFDLASGIKTLLGTTNTASSVRKAVCYLETPIVIPPQIEFYATLQTSVFLDAPENYIFLQLQGTGTLLNTKENF